MTEEEINNIHKRLNEGLPHEDMANAYRTLMEHYQEEMNKYYNVSRHFCSEEEFDITYEKVNNE